MSLQEDGRNPSQRKEYVHHPDLLLVGVDVSKAKHHACMGTQTPMSCRKFECTHTREGFRRFEQPRKAHRDQNRRQRLLIAMEPSGISWQALYERLNSCQVFAPRRGVFNGEGKRVARTPARRYGSSKGQDGEPPLAKKEFADVKR